MTIPVVNFGIQGPPGPVAVSAANASVLAATPTLPFIAGTIAYVQSLKGTFSLDPTSATPENATIIAAQGGGNWILVASGIPALVSARSFGATGLGVVDEAPFFQAALNQLSGTGISLYIPAGTYKIATVVNVPAHVKIVGGGISTTKIVSAITAGPALNCTFLATNVNNVAGQGTLASSPTLYGTSFTTTVSLALYSWVQLQSHLPTTTLHVATYQVVAVSGGPTFTYTVDRAILRPFVMGDTVLPVTTMIEGVDISGFTISGTATRAIDMIGVVRCRVADIVIDGSAGNYFNEGSSFDTGGFDNEYRNVRVVGAGVAHHGLLHESAERARTIDCRTDGCTGNGQTLWDSYASVISNPSASGCTTGVFVGGDSALTVGSNGCEVIGGNLANNTQDYEFGRSTRCSLIAPSSAGAGLAGVLIEGVDSGSGRAFDVVISGGNIKDSNIVSQLTTGSGIVLQNCDGVEINGVIIDGPYASGLLISSGVTRVSGNVGIIRNVVAAGGRQAGILNSSATTGRIIGVFADTAAYGVYFEGGVTSRFVADAWEGLNLSSGRVANATGGIVDGVFFKPSLATTVDVTDVRSVVCADASSTTITNPMVNAYDGQAVEYSATNGNTTIDRSNAYLAGKATWNSTPQAGDQAGTVIIGLIYRGALSAAVERYRNITNG